MADSNFRPGDSDNNILRKILETLIAGGSGISDDPQASGLFLASPAGSAGVPTFRAIELTDLPGGFGTGSVTSVAMTVPAEFSVAGSPVTTTGTFAVTKASQSANLVFASPNGAPGVPVFRALVAADLPAAGSGTVTSVAMTVPSGFSVAGSPVTTAGTLAVTLDSQSAKFFLASPTGSAGAPTFRVLAAGDLPAGTGTVTSVAMSVPSVLSVAGSPVTTTGTLAVTLATQLANLVFAGATSGGAATPTFRSLVAADLPAGTGTVTSVAMSVPSILSVAGSPVTTTGTLAVTLATQTANLVFAGATSGGAAVPTFRALVAADLPAGTGSGSVTSVGLAMPAEFSVAGTPVTVAGTLTVTKATQAANIVYAGPSSGGAVEPTFRALVTADMPAGTGSVTSVAMSVPSILSVAGTPVTTTGTLAVTLATQTQNLIFSGPASGGAVVPTFRTLVALDMPQFFGPTNGAEETIASAGTTAIGGTTSDKVSITGTTTITSFGTVAAGITRSGRFTGALTLTHNATSLILPGGANITTAAGDRFQAVSLGSGNWVVYWYEPSTAAGGGSVTSVALTVPAEFSVAGSPVTTSGTLAISKATQLANLVYAGPTSGGAVEPIFRTLVTADMPAGTGTVTSVAMSVPSILSVAGSPVTTTGTLAVTLATQAANLVFAGPSSGGAVVPTFRTLVTADMPAGTGTVTSVAMTVPSGFSVAGSPVTTTGTLAVTLASQSPDVFLVSPSASSGAPTFRALIYGDVPEIFEFALSDETTAITTGTAKLTWRAPRAFTVTAVRASLSTASSSGTVTVDINDGAGTIMTTNKLTIDATEKTSTTAAVAAGITDSTIADDAEITFDIDVAGTGAMGLKVKIYAI